MLELLEDDGITADLLECLFFKHDPCDYLAGDNEANEIELAGQFAYSAKYPARKT